MGSFHHEQESFAAGEVSPRVQGRIRSEIYGRALSLCRNWMVFPQGPILMRPGSVRTGAEAAVPRIIPFRSSSSQEDWVAAITPGHLRLYTRAGLITGDSAELISNNDFSNGLTGWTFVGGPPYPGGYGGSAQIVLGVCQLNFDPQRFSRFGSAELSKVVNGLVIGNTYRLSIRFTGSGLPTAVGGTAKVGTTPGGGEIFSGVANYATSVNKTITFVATTNAIYLDFYVPAPSGIGAPEWGAVYPCSLKQVGSVIDLAAPWTVDQLAAIQWVGAPAQDALYLAHPNVQTQVLTFTAPSTWALTPAAFTNKPAEWNGTNWPGICEVFQGRLLLGSTPAQPNSLWGSRSGAPLDFSMATGPGGAVLPSDAFMYVISTKGRLRWTQGQKSLLIGAEFTEHSAIGQSGVISPGDIEVRDESAYGSTAIQAVHIGDQVLFVTRDRRHVRSMSYSLQDNGWVSRALTFLADHITEGGIIDVAFARSPFPRVFALLSTGDVVAATYDRAEQVIAWWRVDFGVPVSAISVGDTPDGSVLWVAIGRTGSEISIEYMPLHETGAVFCDASVTGVVANDGTFSGLDHLEGILVRVIVDGALDASDGQAVAGGKVQGIDVSLAGKAITVGVGYRATAKTLPPEGGNPKGTAQLSQRRVVQGIVRVNDSAAPLVNGQRAGVIEDTDRSPSTPMDSIEPRYTGDLEFGEGDRDDAGVCTIEQDLPFRTEVLALFTVINVQDVH